jgi:hypothetical protein
MHNSNYKKLIRKNILILLLACFPFILMVLVNETSEPYTFEYRKDKCTRYCHNHSCPHTTEKYKNNKSSTFSAFEKIYTGNIGWLKNNGMGLSYKEINLLLYAGLTPLIMTLLLWGALRKQSYGKTDR